MPDAAGSPSASDDKVATETPMPLRTRVSLTVSDAEADWHPDPLRPGAWVLNVDGAEQSTLVPRHPTTLVYEYLERIAHVLDQVLEQEDHPSVLHLGGGALTLLRRLEVSAPGIRQVVVDLDAELMDFVVESFPLAFPKNVRMVIGDVREALPDVDDESPYSAVVLDIALDQHSPARLLSTEYMVQLLKLAQQDGAVVINVGDDAGLPATRTLVSACRAAGASVFVTALSDVLSGDYTGNVILVASHTPWTEARLDALRAAGPFPGTVLSGMDVPTTL